MVVGLDVLIDECSDGLDFLSNVSVGSGLEQELIQLDVSRSAFLGGICLCRIMQFVNDCIIQFVNDHSIAQLSVICFSIVRLAMLCSASQ